MNNKEKAKSKKIYDYWVQRVWYNDFHVWANNMTKWGV